MLATPRARANGLAFVVGWIAGLSVLGTIVLLASSGAGATDAGAPADWVSWLKLVLGLLMLLFAVKQWRGRPRGDEQAELPKWMQTIDKFTAGRSAGFGALLSSVNPKNLLISIAAAAAIAQTGIPGGQQAIALAVFVLIGTLGVGTPVVLYLVLGERSKHMLDELKVVDGPEQRGDHGRAAPGDRREAPRRRRSAACRCDHPGGVMTAAASRCRRSNGSRTTV